MYFCVLFRNEYSFILSLTTTFNKIRCKTQKLSSNSMQTGLIILAAGQSSRMGLPKQLLPIQGKSLLLRIIEEGLKTSCYPVSVVLGAHKEQIVPSLVGVPVNLVDNPRWVSGMASSIQMGLVGSYMIEKNIDSVIIVPSDMPRVNEAVLSSLISTAKSTDRLMVACRYDGILGVPALFKREAFTALLDLKGDQGARKLFADDPSQVAVIDFPAGSIDLDTPEAYQHYIRQN